jgi:hypothetical protein
LVPKSGLPGFGSSVIARSGFHPRLIRLATSSLAARHLGSSVEVGCVESSKTHHRRRPRLWLAERLGRGYGEKYAELEKKGENTRMAKRIDPSLAQRGRLIAANAEVCCVCKTRGIGLHLHHIDGDHSNTVDTNLAVLCVKDHDNHHRPSAYSGVNHIELGADRIRELKTSWEAFVIEARKPQTTILSVLSLYGSVKTIHSMKLAFQWADGRIEFERLYHLHLGPPTSWIDLALEELAWLGKSIKLVMINRPLEVEHCPCCLSGMSLFLNEEQALKFTSEQWKLSSIMTVYINPTRPSLAISVFLETRQLYQGHLHRCGGGTLHYVGDGHEERTILRRLESVRSQASRIVQKVEKSWNTASIIYGTRNPDRPEIIPSLRLPTCWERRSRRRRA